METIVTIVSDVVASAIRSVTTWQGYIYFSKPTQETQRRRHSRIHLKLYHCCLGIGLIAVHSRLGVRSGYSSLYARRLGSQISIPTDGPTDPFLTSRVIAIRQFKTSIVESDFDPSSNQGVRPTQMPLQWVTSRMQPLMVHISVAQAFQY